MNKYIGHVELADDLVISRIITGLWQVADMERSGKILNPENAAAAMDPYIEAGLTTFDMADHYGSAEEIAGICRQKHGQDIQLFTKWVPKPGQTTRDDVRTAVQRSLKRMQTDRLDLLQFHAWNYADPVWLDCLYWLDELRQEGLIRYLGLTNTDTAHLNMVLQSGIQVISNQVSFSLLDQRAATGMTDLCMKKDIKLLAFGTIAGGFLSEMWLDKPEPQMQQLKTWSQMKYKRFIDSAGGWKRFQGLLHTIRIIADKHGVSYANIACRFILANPAVAGVIIGARLGESEHIQDNQNIFQLHLDQQDFSQLQAYLEKMHPIPGDCGDEYRKPPFLTASGDLSHHLDSFPKPYNTATTADGRVRVLSGTPWESFAGYCRAVRNGDRIWISGTTAVNGERLIGGTDAAAQTHFIFDKIEGALQSLDSSLRDVVRTRIFVKNINDWEAVARAHGERFRDIQPANTLVQAQLVGEDYLVEIEVEAVYGKGKTAE